MNLLSIEIKDFMSIENVSIDFESGIISVIGSNKDAGGATSNGSGKSALFDAIVWAIFGKCIRPVSGEEVIRRGKDQTSITLFFTKDENTYSITRTRGTKAIVEFAVSENGKEPRDLTQGIATLTQGKIDEVIGMDYRTFLSVATFDLDALRFARATDKEQKEILERLLDLGIYNLALDKTRKEIAAKEKDLLVNQNNKEYNKQTEQKLIRQRTDSISTLIVSQVANDKMRNKVTNILALIDIENKDIDNKIKEFGLLVKGVQASSIEIDNNKINRFKAGIAQAEQYLKDRQASKAMLILPDDYVIDPKFLKDLEQQKITVSVLESNISSTQREKNLIESQIELVENQLGKSCKECNRPLTENELGNVLENYANKVLKLIDEEKELDFLLGKAKFILHSMEISYKEEYQKVIDSKNAQKDIRQKALSIDKEINDYRNDIVQWQQKIKIEENQARLQLANQVASYQDTIRNLQLKISKNEQTRILSKNELDNAAINVTRAQNALDNILKELDSIVSTIATNEATISQQIDNLAYLKYWEKAFSYQGIRSVLLDDVAAKLTENANKFLKHMMGGSLWIDCHTQSTNKDGEKRERFEVQTFNSYGAGTYYGNSKGEQQRIDIALSLALHDIARTRSNSPIGFTIFDEVFERLDEAGCDSIISLLHKERDNFGTVFVVSHNPNLTIRFPKRLEFVKQNGITSLVKRETVCEKLKPELSEMVMNTSPIVQEPMKKRSRGRPPKMAIS